MQPDTEHHTSTTPTLPRISGGWWWGGLLLLMCVVIAVATAVESGWGTDAAHLYVYGTWWFCALWGIIAIAGTWWIVRRRMWHKPILLMLHVALLLILTGALVTHLTSESGQMWIHEGEAVRTMWVQQRGSNFARARTLPFMICLEKFHVEYDQDGKTPSDYVSDVILADKENQEHTTIRMNQIGRTHGYRIYQTSYDLERQATLLTVSYDPWGTGITYAGYALLALSMCLYRPRSGSEGSQENHCDRDARKSEGRWNWSRAWRKTGTVLCWAVAIVLSSYMVISVACKPLVPVLRSPYLVIHIGTIMVGYVLLIVSIIRRSLLRPAVCFLAVGIFLGAVWANVSWGTYWSWDPKESWALITLLLYSLPLHSQSLPWFRSQRHYRLYSLLCLLSLLMTYFGVNFLLGGMHSY